MRGCHPQSYVTLRYGGHVSNKKHFISTFTRSMDPKLTRVVTQDEGTPPTTLRDTSTMGSHDKSKALYLHFHKAYRPKLSRVETQDDLTLPTKSRSTLWSLGKEKTLYFHISTQCLGPKLSSVLTQDEVNPPKKLRDTSIGLSRDKSKIFCLNFHKAEGPQTQQDSDQNEKTPPNESCATWITPSRGNYLVGSVNSLLKTGRCEIIMTKLKMCSLYKGSS